MRWGVRSTTSILGAAANAFICRHERQGYPRGIMMFYFYAIEAASICSISCLIEIYNAVVYDLIDIVLQVEISYFCLRNQWSFFAPFLHLGKSKLSEDYSLKLSLSASKLSECISLFSMSLSPWFSAISCLIRVSCSDWVPKAYISRNIFAIFDILNCSILFSQNKADVVCYRSQRQMLLMVCKEDKRLCSNCDLTRSAVSKLSYSRCSRNTASLCEFYKIMVPLWTHCLESIKR